MDDKQLAQIQHEATQIQDLGVDTAKLDKAISDRLTLQGKIADTQAKMIEGDPSSKNYDKDMLSLSNLVQGYQLALENNNGTILKELDAARFDAYEQRHELVKPERERFEELDKQMVETLVKFNELTRQRDEATQQFNQKYDRLVKVCKDLRLPPELSGNATPWGQPWPGTRLAIEQYVLRFLKMGASGVIPSGDELMPWFSRRHF